MENREDIIARIKKNILKVLSQAEGQTALLSQLGDQVDVPEPYSKLNDCLLQLGKDANRADYKLYDFLNEHLKGVVRVDRDKEGKTKGHPRATLSGTNEGFTQKEEKLSEEEIALMDKKLLELIGANLSANTPRTLQLSRLNTKISAAGYGKWSDCLYPWEKENGKAIGMHVWAEHHFSEHYLVKSNDGLVWYLEEKEPNSQAAALYPGNIDWKSPESQDEVNAMHDFAYMGASGFDETLRRQLSNLSGYVGTDLNQWAAFVAHCIARANLLGEGRYPARSEEDGKEYLAISLVGLTAPKNRQIYMVFVQQEESEITSAAPQRWKLHSCCYPGNFGQGKWLKDVLQVPVHSQRQVSVRDVSSTLEQLGQCRVEKGLISALKAAVQDMEAGLVRDNSPLIAALEEERKIQNLLRNQLYEFGMEIRPEDSISSVRERLEQDNTASKQLENYLQRLLDLIRGNHSVFGEVGEETFRTDEAFVETFAKGAELTDKAAGRIGELTCYHAAVHLLEDSAEFKELSERIAKHLNIRDVTLYLKVFESDNKAQLKAIYEQHTVRENEWNALLRLLSSAQEESDDEEELQSVFTVDNEERSRVIRAFLTSDRLSEEQFNQAFAAPNDFETAIINRDINRILVLAEDPEKFGYDDDTISKINDNIYRTAELPGGLTPLYAGNRLEMMIGNARNQAERYWLSAVRTNSAAYTKLLELYMTENRSTDFMTVYTNAPEDIRSEFRFRHYMIKCCHAAENYQDVLNMVRENPAILYHSEGGDENLIMIYDCAVLEGDQELIECCTQIQKHYSNMDKDQLDDAIIGNQLQWIMQFTEDPTVMETHYPLDEKQMEHLRSALDRRDLPEGDSSFERALRLWMLQKNRNCMAEYYMWRAVDRDSIVYQAETLVLPLLEESQRDAEMYLLYKSYEKELDSSNICREYLLRLVLRTAEEGNGEEQRVEELCSYVRGHLADTVLSAEYDKIAQICQNADPALHALLRKLKDAQGNAFYAALLGGNPGELDDEKRLAELGFSCDEISHIIAEISVAKMSKMQAPVNMAWRFYRFVGLKDGVVEALSDYALEYDKEHENEPDKSHLSLLEEICGQTAEWSRLSELMERYPQLSEKYPRHYATWLVRTHQYELYAAQKDALRPYLEDEDRHIFDLIAALLNEQCDDETCLRILKLSEEEILSHPDEMIYLSRWLTEHGAVTSWSTLIPVWFMQAIKTYTMQQCAALLSADGLLSECALTGYQEQWSGTQDGIPAAVFIGKHLGGAEPAQPEESYYNKLMERYMEDAHDASVLAQLRVLYPERTESIRIRSTLLTLQSSGDASVDPVDMDRLCERIKDASLPVSEQESFSDSLLEIDTLPAALVSPAIGLWSRLLAEDKLTGQAMVRIRAHIRALPQRPASPEAAALLAGIYGASGCAAMKALAAAGEDPTQRSSLFNILSECTRRSEMNCFFADAQMFVSADAEDEELLSACAQQEEYCSDADADRILRAFLNTNGTRDHQALRNLPLAENPERRLWVLEQCALLSHKNEDWRYCINYAETTGQINMVPGLFGVWLEDAGDKSIELIAVMEHMNSLLQLDNKVISGDVSAQADSYRKMFPALCAAARQILRDNYVNIKRYQKTAGILTCFAVRFGCAEQLVSDDATLAIYLRSSHRECSGVRVALLCRLLLAGMVSEAKLLLRKVADSNVELKPFIMNEQHNRPTRYYEFFMGMQDEEALADYVKRPEIRVLLERFLPDGYIPTADRLRTELVWPLLTNPDTGSEKLWAAARALDIMHELNPWDPVITRAMFYVIKQVYDRESSSGRLAFSDEDELIAMLYRSQEGICRSLCEQNAYRDAPRYRGSGTVNVQLSDLLLTGALVVSELDEQAWGNADEPTTYLELQAGIAKANKVAVMSQEGVRSYFSKNCSVLNELKASAQQEEKQIAKHMILSRVTGCWRGIVRYLFNAEVSFRKYDEWCWDDPVGNHKANYHNVGLLRSLLQVYFELPTDQQAAYKAWIADNKSSTSKDTDAFKKAEEILTNENSLLRGFVKYPLEETATFLGLDFTERCLTSIVDKLNIAADDEDRRSGVGEAWRGLDYKALEQCARWTIDIQNGSNNHIFELGKRSMKLGGRSMDTINAERFNLAYSYFHAANVQDGAYACAILGQVKTPRQTLYNPDVDMTNALLRILEHCPDHLPRFFANLAVDWNKKYSLMRGKTWGNDNNGEDSAESIRGFLLQLYPVLSGDNPIGRKQNSDEYSAAARDFVLSDNDTNRRRIRLELLYHLQNYQMRKDRLSPEKKWSLPNRYTEESVRNFCKQSFFRVFPSLEEFAGDLSMDKFLLTIPKAKWQKLPEKDLLREKFRFLERSALDQPVKLAQSEDHKRDFVARVLSETNAAAHAKQSREDIVSEINSSLVGKERRAACAKLYLLERDAQPRLAKLRLGLEELDYQNSVGQASGLAADTLLELSEEAARCTDAERESDVYKKFSEATLLRELPPMFRKNCSTVGELIVLYVKNYSAFAAIGKLLSGMQDSSERGDAQGFLNVLEGLRDAQDNLPDETRLEALKNAQRTLSKVSRETDEQTEWTKLRHMLLNKIIEAINTITAMPIIGVRVLNRKGDPTRKLFGQIENTGNRTAENLVLTVSFTVNNSSSTDTDRVVVTDNQRHLNSLRPGKTAAFGIEFEPKTDKPELEYTITVSYTYEGRPLSIEPVVRTFVQQEWPETLESPGFSTHEIGIEEFTTEDGKDVYSTYLVGRKIEKDNLRSYFSGSFGSYQNTVIYGFRRTGKTTLLRYLYKYLEMCTPDDIYPIEPISCQEDKGEGVIETLSTFREALVERVLRRFEQYHPDGAVDPADSWKKYAWEPLEKFALGKPWLSEGYQEGDDLSSDEILNFYQRLSKLIGKKLVVFMDEFDVLFRRDTDAARLTTLDALLTTDNTYVRFVLCGSNYMCKLMLDCQTQAFQRIKTQQIDRVSDDELQKYLEHKERTGANQTALIFTPEALKCIYRLTNGIIWFAGRMMEEVVRNLEKEHRRTVYPDDLVAPSAIGELLSNRNCKQFVEGCDEDVYTALARRSVSDETLVPEKDIENELQDRREILEPTLQLMEDMRVIKREVTTEGRCVRFTCELYRRYFRTAAGLPDSESNPVDQQMFKANRREETVNRTGKLDKNRFR